MKRLSYFVLLVLLSTWGCREESQEVVSPALEYIDVPFSLGGGGSVEIVSGGRVADDPAMILDEFFTDSLYFRFYTDDGLVDENISILKTGTVITLPRVQGNIALSNFPFDDNGNIAEYTFYPGILSIPDYYALRDSILFSNLSFAPGTSNLSFDLTRIDGKLTVRLNSDIPLDVSLNIENAFGFDYIFDGSNGGESAWSDNGFNLSLADFVVVNGEEVLPPPWIFERDIYDPASPSYNPNGGEAFYPAWRTSSGDFTITLSDDFGDVFTWTNSKEVFFPGMAKEIIVNINYNSGVGQPPTASVSVEGDVSSFTDEFQILDLGNSFCFTTYDTASLLANDWLFSRVLESENNTSDKFESYEGSLAGNYMAAGPITTEVNAGYNYGVASPPIVMGANDEINVQFDFLNVGTIPDAIEYSIALWNVNTGVYTEQVSAATIAATDILTTYAAYDGTFRIVAFANFNSIYGQQVAFANFCLNKTPGIIFSADFENINDASKFPFQHTHTTGSVDNYIPSNFTPNSILNSTSTSGVVGDHDTDGDDEWVFESVSYNPNQSITKVIATNPMRLRAGDNITATFEMFISGSANMKHRIYLWDRNDNSVFAYEAASILLANIPGTHELQTTVPSNGNYSLVLASTLWTSGSVVNTIDDILITRD